MHYSSWLTLAFSASAIARPEGVVDQVGRLRVRDVQDVRNLPAVKSTIELLTKDGEALDKAIQGLTKENAATQVNVIVKALDKMNVDTSAQAAKLSKSGAVGMLEISGLLSAKNKEVWTGLATEALRVANQTSQDMMAKRDITKALPEAQLATLSKAIKSQKKGIMDLVVAAPGQIPPAVKSQMESAIAKQAANPKTAADGSAAPAPKIPNLNDPAVQKKLSASIDDFLDQVVNVVSGKQESFKMPEGVTLPPGVNLPGVAPTEEASAAPAGSKTPAKTAKGAEKGTAKTPP
ncbi:hypothetical protein BLS_000602 [Venturia inaequalis]|uniref:Cell wall protein n=1 Tax=Venturia inaequalis TaxID=5025 RepID=A0A8H3YY90_VENIN|nr:hypothetical protein EG328_004029 [Venturia inaequalis]KAE9978478.1 hypothetical protein BLS_000602 [Venturia inaequalis]KAE9989623.1 hypothetical protein EG327_002459 [Venturia inaequalis]RDI79880.1 Mannosyl phosphorylinositol ceramide synthase [Venturia inaequalis]